MSPYWFKVKRQCICQPASSKHESWIPNNYSFVSMQNKRPRPSALTNTIFIKINCISLFVHLQCAELIAVCFIWLKRVLSAYFLYARLAVAFIHLTQTTTTTISLFCGHVTYYSLSVSNQIQKMYNHSICSTRNFFQFLFLILVVWRKKKKHITKFKKHISFYLFFAILSWVNQPGLRQMKLFLTRDHNIRTTVFFHYDNSERTIFVHLQLLGETEENWRLQ